MIDAWRRNKRMSSICSIVLGFVLVLWPKATLAMATTILGYGVLLMGIVGLGMAWSSARRFPGGGQQMMLLMGLIAILLGLFVIARPYLVASLIPWIVGLVIVMNGLMNLSEALSLRRIQHSSWVMSMVIAVVTVILGFSIMGNALGAAGFVIKLIGFVVIFNGVSNLWILSRLR